MSGRDNVITSIATAFSGEELAYTDSKKRKILTASVQHGRVGR
jgi:hypothetical protein